MSREIGDSPIMRTSIISAGAIPISEVQRQALKTSDGLYFLSSNGLQMYVKISESAILLLNHIHIMSVDDRNFNVSEEDRVYVI